MKKSFLKKGSNIGLILGLIFVGINIFFKGRLGYAILYPMFILISKNNSVCSGQFCWMIEEIVGMTIGSIAIIILFIVLGHIIEKGLKLWKV
ncbi:hypothetical protein HOD61_02285 [archaeon]|jgi:hypothetical protein|nr:hypothetical protein [archaeon]